MSKRRYIRKPHEVIPPFPADIDREKFANWLSGFTDGEGCFYAGIGTDCRSKRYHVPTVRFEIGLRHDDIAILRLIRSYFGCGTIQFYERKKPISNKKPAAHLTIQRSSDLISAIIPHFVAYPLRAKKARDFEIWRPIAVFTNKIMSAKRQSLSIPKWSLANLDLFRQMSAHLRANRNAPPNYPMPLPALAPQEHYGLFDVCDP